MDILLKSRTDIVSWGAVFRILGYELSVSIWKIVDIPEEVINNPNPILDVAKSFFVERTSIWSPNIMTSDEEVASHLEAQRMIDLSRLYDCFGRIVKAYGEQTAINLYEWGDRNFIHDKSVFWWSWRAVFSKQLRNKTAVIFSNSSNYKQILGIVKDQFKQESAREENLRIEFEKLCQKFSANPEEMNRLNSVSISNITVYNNFDDVNGELSNIFGFEGVLSTDCAYKIWQRINANFEIEVREKIFQWGVKESKDIGAKINQKLKKYCLSV